MAARKVKETPGVTAMAEPDQIPSFLDALRSCLDTSDCGIIMVDATLPDLPIVHVSEGFTQLTGYESEEILGRNCRFLQGKDVGQPALHTIRKALNTGTRGNAVLRNYKKDGTPFWNHLHISPIKNKVGKVLAFIGIQSEVTSLMTELAARSSLAHIVDVTAAAIYTKSLDGKITTWNDGCRDLYGWDSEAIIGQPITRLCPEHLQHEPFEIIEQLLQGKHVRNHETQRMHKDGSKLSVSVTVSPCYNEARKICGGAVIEHSIEKQVYERQQKNNFVATLVHDLKNPLLGNNRILDLLNKRNLPEQDRTEITRALKLSNDRMLTLVNNMLDVYRNDAGLIKAVIGEFAIWDLVEACITELGPLAMSRQTEIKNNTQTNLKIKADNHLLSRVMLNILDNAIKFNRGEAIEVFSEVRENTAVISVQDHGPGIAEEQIATVFQRFSGGSTNKYRGGTGLGLYLCRQLIDLMKGTISCESEEGKGSVFKLCLPLAANKHE